MKIRYHHLMCIPRFKGEGYSQAFCNNMQKIKNSIKDGNYDLVDSCDDVCAFCPNNINGICKNDDKVRFYDFKVKEALSQGKKPVIQDICADCQWYYICSKI